MSMHPLSETRFAARSDSKSGNLIWLGKRGQRNAKERPAGFKGEGCSRKAVIPKFLTAGEVRGDVPLGPPCVIINFALAGRSGRATQARDKLLNEIGSNLTLTDCVVVAYLMASVAFYPAVVWLLLS